MLHDSEKKQKIGILGSAFDPIHYAHCALGIVALNTASLDEVWFVPSPNRWDKTPHYKEQSRFRWATLATQHLQAQGLPILTSDAELKIPTYKGTYEFLKSLEQQHTQAQFVLILGEDSYRSLGSWRDPATQTLNGERLKAESEILVMARPSSKTQAPFQLAKHHTLLPSFESQGTLLAKYLPTKNLSLLSSSSLRERLTRKEALEPFIYPAIFDEIIKEGL